MAPALYDATELLRLHDCLLNGVDVREAVATSLLHSCRGNFRRRLSRVDPAWVEDGINRAVQSYLSDPRSFDPTKGRLDSFIERAAWRNVIDLLRSDRARHAREALWAQECAGSVDVLEAPKVPQTPRAMWPLLISSRTDLTDYQWALVETLFPPRLDGARGRPARRVRPILNVLLSMLRIGGWQNLPRQHRSSRSARRYFLVWCRLGILKETLDRLEADLRFRRRSHS